MANLLAGSVSCLNPVSHSENHQGFMWLFTRYGFYSAVCARQGTGGHHQKVDPTRIMVRARVRGHLEALQQRFKELLGPCEILESPHTDYAYRFFVDKSAWSQVLAALSDDLDYDNFKSEVARFQGRAGDAYESALHQVWGTMNKLQR